MLEKRKWKQRRYSYDNILIDCKEALGKDSITAEEAMKYILGDPDGYSDSEYVIYKYRTRKDRKLIYRLNSLWVAPLFVLSIPFQWLFRGEVGVSRNSRIGSIVNYLVGFDN